MWNKSSSEKPYKFGEYSCYNSRDLEFFLGVYFFGVPCKHQHTTTLDDQLPVLKHRLFMLVKYTTS